MINMFPDQYCKVTLTHKLPTYIGIVLHASNSGMPLYFFGTAALLVLNLPPSGVVAISSTDVEQGLHWR